MSSSTIRLVTERVLTSSKERRMISTIICRSAARPTTWLIICQHNSTDFVLVFNAARIIHRTMRHTGATSCYRIPSCVAAEYSSSTLLVLATCDRRRCRNRRRFRRLTAFRLGSGERQPRMPISISRSGGQELNSAACWRSKRSRRPTGGTDVLPVGGPTVLTGAHRLTGQFLSSRRHIADLCSVYSTPPRSRRNHCRSQLSLERPLLDRYYASPCTYRQSVHTRGVKNSLSLYMYGYGEQLTVSIIQLTIFSQCANELCLHIWFQLEICVCHHWFKLHSIVDLEN